MRIYITIECNIAELSHALKKISEKITGEDLTPGEYLLTDEHVTGKMFIEDTEGFLTDESYKALAGTIKEQRRQYASELPI